MGGQRCAQSMRGKGYIEFSVMEPGLLPPLKWSEVLWFSGGRGLGVGNVKLRFMWKVRRDPIWGTCL